jgi:hypothetical protein
VATYEYDDFRVSFTPQSDGNYDVRAKGSDGVEHAGTFAVPLSRADLERTVLGLARSHGATDVDATVTRDIGRGTRPPRMDAQRLGAALADALLTGEIGRHYDAAVGRAAENGRGLRLSLSLADAPELLNLPWEFLYRRPRFLASQRHSPLVRHLDTGSLAPPPSIETTVRMLGVIAAPLDLAPLDVAAERQRVEQAVAKVAGLGRIELDWLEPATPRGLRQALRDDSYHILHYVGHSDFTADGQGILLLEDGPDRHSVPLDSTALANLLSDQTRLRLVVLNSCDGARTTLVDPYAGVATTLIQLGVPAVVAMQFEITDAAAIVFADELYTNLIGRQDPIDAAVAEARKAIYIEVDKVEWATPVLFVRHPEVELFRFEVPAAPLPPRRAAGDEGDAEADDLAAESTVPKRPRRTRLWVAVAAVAALLVGTGTVIALTGGGGDDDGTTEYTGPSTVPPDLEEPRPRTGDAALQFRGADGASRLFIYHASTDEGSAVTAPTGAIDTQPAWDRNTNRLAFTRSVPGGAGSSIWYAVPGDGSADDPGKEPAVLIEPAAGESVHFPMWARDGALFYFSSVGGCTPGPGCEQELHRATFLESDEGEGFAGFTSFDVLTLASDEPIAAGFSEVRSVAPDPLESKRVAVVDATGLHLVVVGGEQTLHVRDPELQFAVFVTEADHLLTVTQGVDAASTHLRLYHIDGGELDDTSLARLDQDGAISSEMERPASGITALSLTPTEDDTAGVLTIDELNDERPPAILIIAVESDPATLYLSDVEPLEPLRGLGHLEAIAG